MPRAGTLLAAVLLTLSPAAAASAGDASVIPFPFLFYTPETELAGGGTVLVYLRGDDSGARPSIVSPIFVYTAKKQTMAFLSGEFYLDDENWRLNAGLAYVKYPNTFWGLGNDAPDAAEEDFTPRTTSANLSLEKRVAPALYLGGRLGYARRTLLETEAGGLLAGAGVPGVRDGSVVSAGVSISRDTRDSTTYPREGGRRDLVLAVAGGALGGDYDYRAASLNLAEYRGVSDRSVLAVRAVAEARSDAPPFDLLPQLGGDALLRGYFGGRYRDRNLLACQAEWRAHLWRRFGAVTFAGLGQVARDLDGFGLDGFHAAGGCGLRFVLNAEEGLNLRADMGFGKESSGFYLSLGEAF
ncbi:BamA/TamA family outer membrane protein [bacterium]|nr:BamA/TamA family outer membrane protein [bacterium]MBU1677002.1 BamA/TamA family outer membrane protein [bacterium]